MKAKPLRVMVVTPLGRGGWGGIDRLMDEVRNELERTGPADLTISFLTSRGNGHLVEAIPRMFGCIAAIWLASLRGRLDVLHINLASRGSACRKLILARLARALRVPYVLHLHGPEFNEYWEGLNKWADRAICACFRNAAQVVVLGSFWRDVVAAKVPDARKRLRILHNATRSPAKAACGMPAQPQILFLGRLGERKGVPTLVEALGRIAHKLDWKAIIAGDGPVRPVQLALESAGIEQRVALPGWVQYPAVEELLASADILVLPSHHEGLPMAVIEGMAHGIAVVATRVGAVPDIITHEVTGLLVQPGDAAQLADTLSRLLEDASLRARLGANARLFHAENLEITGYVTALIGIWRQVGPPPGHAPAPYADGSR